jgi:hypothetical protein
LGLQLLRLPSAEAELTAAAVSQAMPEGASTVAADLWATRGRRFGADIPVLLTSLLHVMAGSRLAGATVLPGRGMRGLTLDIRVHDSVPGTARIIAARMTGMRRGVIDSIMTEIAVFEISTGMGSFIQFPTGSAWVRWGAIRTRRSMATITTTTGAMT